MARWVPAVLSNLTERLAVRLLTLLSLALLPLGLIAVLTTAEALRTARQGADRALVGLTADAVGGKRVLIESALASARALGPLAAERVDDLDECNALLANFVQRSGVYSFAGFIEADGRMRCVSSGVETDFSSSPVFQDLRNQPMSRVTASPLGATTNDPVVIATQPVYSDTALEGFLSISVSQHSLELMGRMTGDEVPRMAVIFNAQGMLITGDRDSEDDARAELPAGIELSGLASHGNHVFRGRTEADEAATFVVAELIPRRLYALGTWPKDSAGPTGLRAMIVPMLFPVLMWVASLGVLYFAVYHLVIRHVRTLNRQMRRFALGQRDALADLPRAAPSELRELGGTFRKMTWIIARDEAEREADLAEKTVLLKEVHHRVKNNLQLIASILNLQMRQLQDPAARAVLQSVQDRVLGLATIHRSLYEGEQLSDLQADRVLGDILRQLLALGIAPGSGIDVSTRIDPMRMGPDRLVPLSLLLTEAVTNALKHIGRPADGPPWLDVRLRLEGADAVLTVTNSAGTPLREAEEETPSSQLGAELIEAFAMQLGGTLEQGPEPDHPRGDAYALSLRFASGEETAHEPAAESGSESGSDSESGTEPVAAH